MTRPHFTRSALIALSVSFCACSHDATFRLRSGSVVVGAPQNHDASQVRVRTADGAVSVNRCEIDDVFHPGRGAAITGATIAGLSALMIPSFTERDNGSVLVPVVPLAIGAAIGLWGLVTWSDSAEATGEHHLPCATGERPELWNDLDASESSEQFPDEEDDKDDKDEDDDEDEIAPPTVTEDAEDALPSVDVVPADGVPDPRGRETWETQEELEAEEDSLLPDTY